MLQSINRIEEYLEGHDFKSFTENYLVSDAVVRNFEVIGEAAKNIPSEIKSKYILMPWRHMYGLRNIISHQYFGIDYHSLWQIAKEELPENKKILLEILKNEGIE